MKKFRYILLLAVAACFSLTSFGAKSIPEKPDSGVFVYDLAGVMKPDQVKAMNDTLAEFSKKTTNQIMVITVSDLGGEDPTMFANEIGDKWGIGQKGLDNGVIILLKPKTKDEKGKVAIAPGRGLEGALPDAFCKRITADQMIPKLKNGNDYTAAAWAALKVIKPICAGEYTREQYEKEHKKEDSNVLAWFGAIFLGLIGWAIYASRKAKKKQALLEATETPEERAERLAKAAELKKKRDAERAARAAATAAAAKASGSSTPSRPREEKETFGGGSFGGGGASSEW